jgi:adenosine deaminase
MLQQDYQKQMDSLEKLRQDVPYISEFVVGIDAASAENNTPVYVFAPVFNRARDGFRDSIHFNKLKWSNIRQQSLCFTFHAGEDFRHLLSGIRRIDEVVTYCKFHAGDRIGHGIALGCDIDYWIKQNPMIMIPCGEHLDNLLWVWGVYTKITSGSSEVSIYLENAIYEYAKKIYLNPQGITIPMLYEAYQEEFKEYEYAEAADLTSNSAINSNAELFCCRESLNKTMFWTVEKLVKAKNCRCYREAMLAPIFVEVTKVQEIIIRTVRDFTVKKLSARGIVMEVNPSSNIAIGEIEDMTSHPVFRVGQPLNEDEDTRIQLNVNSDDPSVFNTNVVNEIAYLYYARKDQNVSTESALKWADELRLNGINSSFIAGGKGDKEYYRKLKEVVNTI